ncbi:hypothetical protein PR048_023207 [Dryococelus australis]|uniref:Uncharacterized protein n=1 Tax=Dryococelus australis TaxID=614101 RepID=A0ABQ9GTF0_9NEOP|nr:hypothetical protein PR048_023207 [Dryococelus australis]
MVDFEGRGKVKRGKWQPGDRNDRIRSTFRDWIIGTVTLLNRLSVNQRRAVEVCHSDFSQRNEASDRSIETLKVEGKWGYGTKGLGNRSFGANRDLDLDPTTLNDCENKNLRKNPQNRLTLLLFTKASSYCMHRSLDTVDLGRNADGASVGDPPEEVDGAVNVMPEIFDGCTAVGDLPEDVDATAIATIIFGEIKEKVWLPHLSLEACPEEAPDAIVVGSFVADVCRVVCLASPHSVQYALALALKVESAKELLTPQHTGVSLLPSLASEMFEVWPSRASDSLISPKELQDSTARSEYYRKLDEEAGVGDEHAKNAEIVERRGTCKPSVQGCYMISNIEKWAKLQILQICSNLNDNPAHSSAKTIGNTDPRNDKNNEILEPDDQINRPPVNVDKTTRDVELRDIVSQCYARSIPLPLLEKVFILDTSMGIGHRDLTHCLVSPSPKRSLWRQTAEEGEREGGKLIAGVDYLRHSSPQPLRERITLQGQEITQGDMQRGKGGMGSHSRRLGTMTASLSVPIFKTITNERLGKTVKDNPMAVTKHIYGHMLRVHEASHRREMIDFLLRREGLSPAAAENHTSPLATALSCGYNYLVTTLESAVSKGHTYKQLAWKRGALANCCREHTITTASEITCRYNCTVTALESVHGEVRRTVNEEENQCRRLRETAADESPRQRWNQINDISNGARIVKKETGNIADVLPFSDRVCLVFSLDGYCAEPAAIADLLWFYSSTVLGKGDRRWIDKGGIALRDIGCSRSSKLMNEIRNEMVIEQPQECNFFVDVCVCGGGGGGFYRGNPWTNRIIHAQFLHGKSGSEHAGDRTRNDLVGDERSSSRSTTAALMVGEMGDPRENLPTYGIVPARFPHTKISGPTPPGFEPGSSWWEASGVATRQPGAAHLMPSFIGSQYNTFLRAAQTSQLNLKNTSSFISGAVKLLTIGYAAFHVYRFITSQNCKLRNSPLGNLTFLSTPPPNLNNCHQCCEQWRRYTAGVISSTSPTPICVGYTESSWYGGSEQSAPVESKCVDRNYLRPPRRTSRPSTIGGEEESCPLNVRRPRLMRLVARPKAQAWHVRTSSFLDHRGSEILALRNQALHNRSRLPLLVRPVIESGNLSRPPPAYGVNHYQHESNPMIGHKRKPHGYSWPTLSPEWSGKRKSLPQVVEKTSLGIALQPMKGRSHSTPWEPHPKWRGIVMTQSGHHPGCRTQESSQDTSPTLGPNGLSAKRSNTPPSGRALVPAIGPTIMADTSRQSQGFWQPIGNERRCPILERGYKRRIIHPMQIVCGEYIARHTIAWYCHTAYHARDLPPVYYIPGISNPEEVPHPEVTQPYPHDVDGSDEVVQMYDPPVHQTSTLLILTAGGGGQLKAVMYAKPIPDVQTLEQHIHAASRFGFRVDNLAPVSLYDLKREICENSRAIIGGHDHDHQRRSLLTASIGTVKSEADGRGNELDALLYTQVEVVQVWFDITSDAPPCLRNLLVVPSYHRETWHMQRFAKWYGMTTAFTVTATLQQLTCGGGNGRSPRKPADQRHRPARIPRAKMRKSGPGIELGSQSNCLSNTGPLLYKNVYGVVAMAHMMRSCTSDGPRGGQRRCRKHPCSRHSTATRRGKSKKKIIILGKDIPEVRGRRERKQFYRDGVRGNKLSCFPIEISLPEITRCCVSVEESGPLTARFQTAVNLWTEAAFT